MGILQRLHENDVDDSNTLWSTAYSPPAPWWEVAISRDWSDLSLGIAWTREYGNSYWPSWWQISAEFGPWSIWIKKQWGDKH